MESEYNPDHKPIRKRKYVVYKNDLKYRKHREIDPNMVICDDNVKELFKIKTNLDTVEYRINECIEEGGITLDLKCLDLKEFPKINSQLANKITHLFLGENLLTHIPDLSTFLKLELLEINHNKLTEINSLPETLIEFCCRDNEIIKFSSDINCPKLERLDIANNKLKEIPNFALLKTCDCGYNEITQISNYYYLKKLQVGFNRLSHISGCPNMEYLDCKNNPIHSIGTCLKLKHFICSNTNMSSLSKDWPLTVVECFGSKIEKLSYIPSLIELMCDKGQLKAISSKYKILDAKIHKNRYIYLLFEKVISQIENK
jgi:Leucine-rich repeat (LRR) protein